MQFTHMTRFSVLVMLTREKVEVMRGSDLWKWTCRFLVIAQLTRREGFSDCGNEKLIFSVVITCAFKPSRPNTLSGDLCPCFELSLELLKKHRKTHSATDVDRTESGCW